MHLFGNLHLKVKNLVHFNIADNHLFYTDILKLMANLQTLDKLRHLDVSHQRPKYALIAEVIITSFVLPKGLISLDLSGIFVWNKAFSHKVIMTFTNFSQITSFDISQNQIDLLEFPFMKKPIHNKEVDINLSENRFQTVQFLRKILELGLVLKTLNLADNNLVSKHDGTLSKSMFEQYIHLEELDLSSNEIKLIPHEVFVRQTRLKILILRRNYLTLFKLDFSLMINLTILDLSENLLTQLNEATRSDLDALKSRSPNFKLNLFGNPIECTCNSLPFIRWMYDRQDMIEDFMTYTCIHDNTVVEFQNLKTVLADIEFQCSLNLALKLSAAVLAFVVFVTGIGVLLYFRRWDIRFLCIKFVHERHVYERLEESGKEYEYDAFVAYHRDKFKLGS